MFSVLREPVIVTECLLRILNFNCSFLSCHFVQIVHCSLFPSSIAHCVCVTNYLDKQRLVSPAIPALSAGSRRCLPAPISSQWDVSHTPDTAIPGSCGTIHIPLDTLPYPPTSISNSLLRLIGLYRQKDITGFSLVFRLCGMPWSCIITNFNSKGKKGSRKHTITKTCFHMSDPWCAFIPFSTAFYYSKLTVPSLMYYGKSHSGVSSSLQAAGESADFHKCFLFVCERVFVCVFEHVERSNMAAGWWRRTSTGPVSNQSHHSPSKCLKNTNILANYDITLGL